MSGHRWPVVLGIVVAVTSGPATAQDLTQGKTAAQLFAGDCAACHKSPQGLARGGDPRAIASFLREHYTTKPEMAESLANYVVSSGGTRGQPLPVGDSTKPSRGTATSDTARSTEGTRPRIAIPILGDDSKPPDGGDNAKPARPRPVASEGNKPADGDPLRQPGKPRSATALGDAPKPADDKDGPKSQAKPADDAAGDAAKPKPRAASRTDDGKKPGDTPVTTGKLNSYARAGASDKEKVTESAEERANKLRSYATSGEPAPTAVSALPKAVVSPSGEERVTTPDASGDAAKATPSDTPKSPTDDASKSEQNDQSKPAGDDTPKLSKPKPTDAAKPRRTDAANAPQSPMSFFGRIFTGGAKPRNADPPD